MEKRNVVLLLADLFYHCTSHNYSYVKPTEIVFRSIPSHMQTKNRLTWPCVFNSGPRSVVILITFPQRSCPNWSVYSMYIPMRYTMFHIQWGC